LFSKSKNPFDKKNIVTADQPRLEVKHNPDLGMDTILDANLKKNSKLNKSEYEHYHVCASCERPYSHVHKYAHDHPQFSNQCPYEDCDEYFGETPNTTLSQKREGEVFNDISYRENDGKRVSKPALGHIMVQRQKRKIEEVCEKENKLLSHKDGLVQICPCFVGKKNDNFIPKKMHSCACTNTTSISRNLILRAWYTEDRKEEFTNWWIEKRLPVYENYYYWGFFNDDVLGKDHDKWQALSVQNWIDTREDPTKRKEYQEAYDKYKADSMIVDKLSDLLICDAHVKTDEKCVKCDKARNITAQNSLAKVLMGPVVDFVSKCHKKYDISYGSGLNWDERNSKYSNFFQHFADPVKIDIDGSGFDGTQWAWIKKLTHAKRYTAAYDLIMPYIDCDDSHVNEVLNNMMQKVRNRKTNYDYVVEGSVGSGFMSTSDGNTVTAAEYVRFALEGAYIEGHHYFLETCGDDTIIICERADSVNMKKLLMTRTFTPPDTMGNLGQIAKYINIVEPDQGNYLSTVWLKRQDDSVRVLRQPDRVLLFTPWTYNNLRKPGDRENMLNAELALANALSIKAWSNGIRFYEEYANMLIRCAAHYGIKTTKKTVEKTHNSRYTTCKNDDSDLFEEWLEKTYSISQDDLEEYYDACKTSSGYDIRHLDLIDKLSERSSYEYDTSIKVEIDGETCYKNYNTNSLVTHVSRHTAA